jgi:hypothetical protein
MATTAFRNLSSYGNYTSETTPKRGVYRISLDGTIRTVRALGLPYVEIVNLVNSYGNHWFPQRIGYAILSRDKRKLLAALGKKKVGSKTRLPKPCNDLLLCVREASRAAHRERDAAQIAYQLRRHTFASRRKTRKEYWYSLKDRGIIAAHRQGIVHYMGASPQGMAVYEYGDGGMSCFHSTLHPAGVARTPIENHPEVLMVEAKAKAKGISLKRVEVTLLALSNDISGYQRSEPPTMVARKTSVLTCWECGEEGHTSRHCPAAAHEKAGISQGETNHDRKLLPIGAKCKVGGQDYEDLV